jgi:hypothetical protein
MNIKTSIKEDRLRRSEEKARLKRKAYNDQYVRKAEAVVKATVKGASHDELVRKAELSWEEAQRNKKEEDEYVIIGGKRIKL